jgi:hypothetical protein
MLIQSVTITVPDPAETAGFLVNLFDVLQQPSGAGVEVPVGASRLTLVQGPTEQDGYYHLAFDIPEDAVADARDLLAARVPILDGREGGIVTGAPGWESHSVYFNAPGNLNLELIGRHRLPNAITRPFSLSDVLSISEVGIAVDDPVAAARIVQEETGIQPFGEPDGMFAPMGNDDGLLVLVRHGRIWYPTDDQTTTKRPLRIQLMGLTGELQLGASCVLTGTDQS